MGGGGGQLTADNRPLPSLPRPLYQNEVKYSPFDISQERLCTWPRFESEGFWNKEVTCQWPKF